MSTCATNEIQTQVSVTIPCFFIKRDTALKPEWPAAATSDRGASQTFFTKALAANWSEGCVSTKLAQI
jgi:hypothetical protein